MMMLRTALCGSMLVLLSAFAHADTIDFATLNGLDASDANGQNFNWSFGGQAGIVNVRATWPDVLAVDGAMRTPVRGPASFASPFTGTVVFTFDVPLEVAFLATFRSLTRDGLDGGRFEQVRLSSPGPVQFQPAADTTAIYSGVGTNAITADDEFSQSPTLSIWGFIGTGKSALYELRYTGTTLGLSETFNVSVIPEPGALALVFCGVAAVTLLARNRLRLRMQSCDGDSGG